MSNSFRLTRLTASMSLLFGSGLILSPATPIRQWAPPGRLTSRTNKPHTLYAAFFLAGR